MRKSRLILASLFGVLALGLWAAGSSVNKLSTYGFVGRSGDAALIVDMDVARYRGSEKYIPVLIWLGHTDNKTLYADRSSFTLTDPKGDKIPLASSQEVTKDYGPTLISNDYTYIRRMPNYGSMVYLANRPIRSVAFFPNPSGAPGILYDNVELPNRTYFWALLYFANPAGKDGGQYTLTYNDPKSHTLIEVPFTIPWQK